jgi:hypothetical protein
MFIAGLLRYAARGEPAVRAGRLLHGPPRCGDPDAGVDGPVVWIPCECGARMARRVEERDALAFND